MKDLWRLLLPGMNVPTCGVEQESPAAPDEHAIPSPANSIPGGETPPRSAPWKNS